MRVALDSALTSPVGLAVAVAPDTGRFAGVVSADAILAQVTKSRAGVAESISIRAAEAAGQREVDGQQEAGAQETASPEPDETGTDAVRDETSTTAPESETPGGPAPRVDQTVVVGASAVDVGPEQTPPPADDAAGPTGLESTDPPAATAESRDPDEDHRPSVHDHEDGEDQDDLAYADDPESGVEPASVNLLSDGREVVADEKPSARASNR
jgi:osmoprotectant transport system ATP-binding protein